MGRGGSTDLYHFKCIRKDGTKLTLDFTSFEDMGLPEETSFWACQFVSHKKAEILCPKTFFYKANCELLRYYEASLPPSSVSVRNIKIGAENEVMELMKSFGPFERVFKRTNGMVMACFKDDNACVAASSAFSGGYFNVSEDGKGLVTHYPRPIPNVYEFSDRDLGLGVVDDVQLFDEKESDSQGRSYATVVVKFVKERFCEHVQVGDCWDGR